MKKIMLILVVLVQTTLFAQNSIEKPLKLKSVAVGTLNDDVLLIESASQLVKKISVNSLLSSKANTDSPTFTGTPTLPTGTIATTQTVGNNSNALATTSFVVGANILKANLSSPTFTGTPTLPTGTIATTQTVGNNGNALATTAFVQAATNLKASLDSPTFTGTTTLPATTTIGGAWPILSNTNQTIGGVKTIDNGSFIFNQRGGYGGVGVFIINRGPTQSLSHSPLSVQNISTGYAAYYQNESTGVALNFNGITGSTGALWQGQNNTVTTSSLNKEGVLTASQFRISSLNTAPTTPTSAGVAGEIRVASNGIFICINTNSWVKCGGTGVF